MARVVPKFSCGVIDGPICTSRIRTAAIEFKLTHSSDLSEGRRTYQNSPFLLTPILQIVVGINCYQRSDAHCHLIPNTLDYEPYMPNISFESYQRSRISQQDPDVTSGPTPHNDAMRPPVVDHTAARNNPPIKSDEILTSLTLKAAAEPARRAAMASFILLVLFRWILT